MSYVAGNDCYYTDSSPEYISGNEAISRGFLSVTSRGNGAGGTEVNLKITGYAARPTGYIDNYGSVQYDVRLSLGYANSATIINGIPYQPLGPNNGLIVRLPDWYKKSYLYFKPLVNDFTIIDGRFNGTAWANLRGLYIRAIDDNGEISEIAAYNEGTFLAECYHYFNHKDDLITDQIYRDACVKLCDVGHNGYFTPDTENPGFYMYTIYSSLHLDYDGIRFFNSTREGDNWLRSEEPEPPAPEDMDELKDDIQINNRFSSVRLFDRDALDELGAFMYTGTNTPDILDGLTMYGENPMNFIVDAFMLPFNPKDFIETLDTKVFSFGTYRKRFDKTHKIVTHVKVKTLGTQTISREFNDFRDYTCKRIYVYLPYCGWYSLDTVKYMGKVLTMKLLFDIRNGNLKYYLFAGDYVVDMFQGSIKTQIPITATDRAQDAMNKVSSAGKIAGAVGKALSGDIGGALTDTISGAYGLQMAPPVQTSGSFASDASVSDWMVPKLYIETIDHFYPANIKTNYGLPDNRVGNLGSNTGFIQADKVQLHSTQTLARQEEIKRLLREGVII